MILGAPRSSWYSLMSVYFTFFNNGKNMQQQCVCVDTEGTPVANTPCGDVIKTHTYGACWEATCERRVCEGDSWRQINYGAGEMAWVRESHVTPSTDEKCSRSGSDCSSVRLVTRAEWGARPPKATTPHNPPLSMVFVHHSAMPSCSTREECVTQMKAIQDLHMDDNGWDDIGYTYLVGGDGGVYEGRGWDVIPAQCKGHNAESYGICIMGDYSHVLPPSAAMQAVKDMIDCGVQQGKVTTGHEVFGHRDGRCTSCPGDALYTEIQNWLCTLLWVSNLWRYEVWMADQGGQGEG